MSDKTKAAKDLRALAAPYANMLAVADDLEAAGGLDSYAAKIKGSIEALRRDEDAAKARVAAAVEGHKATLADHQAQVKAVHTAADRAKAGADEYVAQQKRAANQIVAEARTSASSIIDQAKKSAEAAVAGFQDRATAAAVNANKAEQKLYDIEEEITKRQAVLASINSQLNALRVA